VAVIILTQKLNEMKYVATQRIQFLNKKVPQNIIICYSVGSLGVNNLPTREGIVILIASDDLFFPFGLVIQSITLIKSQIFNIILFLNETYVH
jgi:hypothetical protein